MKSKNNDKKIIDFEAANPKKINIKKIIIVIFLIIIIATVSGLYITYSVNESFRIWWDINVLRKNIEEQNLAYIDIESVDKNSVFAYSSYIAYVKDNKINTYDSSGNKAKEIGVQITNPLINTKDEYAVIAEENGQKIYLIYKNEIIWEKELEGNITRINVTSVGYVSVIVSGTSYKSVIILFDNNGKEVFKTYLSSTIAVDSDISPDNRFMSFAEVNISGTLIQSNIKIISIEKAKESPDDSIIYTYNAPSGNLILNIKYQEKNRLACMYDNSIHIIENEEDKLILDLTENNINFADIEFNNCIVSVKEESEALFKAKITLEIIKSSTEKRSVYNCEGDVKGLYTYGNKIGIDFGLEVHFINNNGWLIKKYTCDEEVKGIVMNNNIAGVIYKKKIEILNI